MIYGRDLFSSGCVPNERFRIVFGKNVAPTESMTAEVIRHRWMRMNSKG